MFRRRQIAAGWRVFVAALAVGLVAAACSVPGAAPAATPVPIPAMTVEASDTALSMPAEAPAGLVAVTVSNSGQAPHAPLFARLNDGWAARRCSPAPANR